MTKTCPECGREFTPKRSSRIYCYDEQCYTIRHRRYNSTANTKNREKERPYGKIRPYTETSNLLLADDICKGWSIKRMAKLYDRDEHDLKQHIEKIIADGTVEKIIRRKIQC
jgi:hypothetical protein